MGQSQLIGNRGEDSAVEYLRGQGFQILERNWRNGRYEIDIIAKRWDEVHFVEVKSRKAGGWTTPEEAINNRKFQSLKRAASLYISLHRLREEPLFDLLAVETLPDGQEQVRLIEGAMQAHW